MGRMFLPIRPRNDMSNPLPCRVRRCVHFLAAAVVAVLPFTTAYAEVDDRNAERLVSGAAGAAAFGIAVTVLDFDGDGENELAIADPAEAVEGGGARGVVRIMKRGPAGNWQVFNETSLNSGDAQFGLTLATGDFDEDDRDDLLIGAPGHGDGGGAVYLLYHNG